jgi:hypothetical protein
MRGFAIIRQLLLAASVTAALAASASADNTRRIDELSTRLSSSSSARTRVTAVAALARLDDKATLRPLVNALGDPDALVRAVAASALGRLGHKASLPALNEAATDGDATVRRNAAVAIRQVRRANDLPEPLVAQATVLRASGTSQAGFGNRPQAVKARPDLYIVVKSTNDDSPSAFDGRTRKVHAEEVKTAMLDALGRSPTVTRQALDAQRYDLDLRNVDVSVIRLEQRERNHVVEVEAQLRLAISDQEGRMLSFLSGGATVQVPQRSFDRKRLPQLRQEAIRNAVDNLCTSLVKHLRRRES